MAGLDKIFKAYDIRGIYPDEINEEITRNISLALARNYAPKKILICADGRASSPALVKAAVEALVDSGITVDNLGLGTTDYFYYAMKADPGYDLGLMITASHNPAEYNGLKIVEAGGISITFDNQGRKIKEIAESGPSASGSPGGSENQVDYKDDYIAKIRSLVDLGQLKEMKIIADPGNGMAGLFLDDVFAGLPVKLAKICDDIDPKFSCRGPNPMLRGALDKLSAEVRSQGADLGLAWDSDADRMFAVSDVGEPVHGDVIVALLAKYYLKKYPGAPIIHDIRASRMITDTIVNFGGKPVVSKVGHAFIKDLMRKLDAPFGGEASGHFYFRDYYYFDSGLLSALVLLSVVADEGKKLSEIVTDMADGHYLSGEINFTTAKGTEIMKSLKEKFADGELNEMDGIRIDYPDWWLSVRASANEPLLRLNIEAVSQKLLDEKVAELSKLLSSF